MGRRGGDGDAGDRAVRANEDLHQHGPFEPAPPGRRRIPKRLLDPSSHAREVGAILRACLTAAGAGRRDRHVRCRAVAHRGRALRRSARGASVRGGAASRELCAARARRSARACLYHRSARRAWRRVDGRFLAYRRRRRDRLGIRCRRGRRSRFPFGRRRGGRRRQRRGRGVRSRPERRPRAGRARTR